MTFLEDIFVMQYSRLELNVVDNISSVCFT